MIVKYEDSRMGYYDINGTQVSSLSLHCPFSKKQGETETGAYSPEANMLILYMLSTKRYNQWLRGYVYPLAYKYLSREGNVFERYKKEPMSKEYVFAFDRGILALNDISEALQNRTGLLLKTVTAEYNKLDWEYQYNPKCFVQKCDVNNWIMRDFQDWCNEYKRV